MLLPFGRVVSGWEDGSEVGEIGGLDSFFFGRPEPEGEGGLVPLSPSVGERVRGRVAKRAP